MDKEYEEKLRYTMCYALRHEPWSFNLILDDNGFCEITSLLKGLENYYNNITINDLNYIVKMILMENLS